MSQGLLISGCGAAYGDLVMMDHSFSPWLGFAIAGTVIAPAVSLYLFRVFGSDLDATDAVFLDLRSRWNLHKPFLLPEGAEPSWIAPEEVKTDFDCQEANLESPSSRGSSNATRRRLPPT